MTARSGARAPQVGRKAVPLRMPLLGTMMAIAFGVAACGQQVSTPMPAGSELPPESALPAVTTEPTTSASVESAADWTWEEQTFEGRIHSVLVDGALFVAVGADLEGGPAAWTSADGWSWLEHPVPDPHADLSEVDAFMGSTMGSLVKWGETLFSFGTLVGYGDHRAVVAWRSSDGASWEVIKSSSALFTDAYSVYGLVASADGLLALEQGFAVPSGRVWRWRPETSWVISPLDSAGTEYASVSLHSAAWDGSRFVIVGAPFRGDYQAETGAIWTSVDGDSWIEVTPPDTRDLRLQSVTAIPAGGFVVVGSEGDGPVAWRSADGSSWTRIALPTSAGVPALSVVRVGPSLVAMGGDDDHTRAWLSTDGSSWSDPFVWPHAYPLSPLVVDEDGAVLVGSGRASPDGLPSTIIIRGRRGE